MNIPLPSPPVSTPQLLAPTPTAQFGRDIDLIKSKTPGGGGIQHPFQIRRVDDDTINVRYGTLNDVVPADVATDIDLSGDGAHTVYLEVEVDIDGLVVAVTLSTVIGAQPADDDYFGYITLGSVVVVDGIITAINQAATHSLRMAMCDREVEESSLINRGEYHFWGF